MIEAACGHTLLRTHAGGSKSNILNLPDLANKLQSSETKTVVSRLEFFLFLFVLKFSERAVLRYAALAHPWLARWAGIGLFWLCVFFH